MYNLLYYILHWISTIFGQFYVLLYKLHSIYYYSFKVARFILVTFLIERQRLREWLRSTKYTNKSMDISLPQNIQCWNQTNLWKKKNKKQIRKINHHRFDEDCVHLHHICAGVVASSFLFFLFFYSSSPLVFVCNSYISRELLRFWFVYFPSCFCSHSSSKLKYTFRSVV